MAESHNPLEQFAIERIFPLEIGGIDASFTNASLFMAIVVVVITALVVLGMSKSALVPGRLQAAVEMFYELIANMLKENIGHEGRVFFPFVFSLFMFILFSNLIGLMPGGFTVTSHIIVTFAMALFVFLMATLIGFVRHGVGFLRLFVPSGTPVWLLPLIVPVEVFSYFIRPVSLSVRLFANMVAGHVMLAVIGGFVFSLGIFGIVPFAFLGALSALEILIAVLQAYIFSVLTCIYLNDAVNFHH